MDNYSYHMSHVVKQVLDDSVQKIKQRLDTLGFCVWPLNPDPENDIPPGFYTIGFTRIGLPEFYVSGMAPYSDEARRIVNQLQELFESLADANTQLLAGELCKDINEGNPLEPGYIPLYQYRPVDATRLMWGQALSLQTWAKAENLVDKVQGIQIVHRDAQGNFPMMSTPNQLLLDWIPYGAVKYKPLMEALKDVATI